MFFAPHVQLCLHYLPFPTQAENLAPQGNDIINDDRFPASLVLKHTGVPAYGTKVVQGVQSVLASLRGRDPEFYKLTQNSTNFKQVEHQ